MIISILIVTVVGVLVKNGLYIQVGNKPGGISYYEVNFVLTIVLILSSLFWLTSIFKLKEIRVILILIGIFFIFLRILFTKIVYAEVNHTRFNSPDGKQKFLVIESSSSELYQKTDNPYLVKYLGNIQTHRRFQTFCTGNYKIEWPDPGVMKVYYKYKSHHKEYRVEDIKYVENNG